MNFITKRLSKLAQKETYVHFLKTLKYSLHVIFHPADGFWDLIHEKRGSYAAATFILIFTLLVHVWKLRFTSFMIMSVKWDRLNILVELATILLPFLIFCVCNWGVTTLFDGKGHLGDIYMGSAYALTPYTLIQIPLIFVSNIVTKEERSFYYVFNSISFLWIAILLFMAMMMIHSYSFGKTIVFVFFTGFGMLVFIFIMLLFFSMVSQAVAFFISLGREVIFRLN